MFIYYFAFWTDIIKPNISHSHSTSYFVLTGHGNKEEENLVLELYKILIRYVRNTIQIFARN